MKYDVAIIGGGPAGMFSAITAAKRGKKVLLLERNNRLGKKLLITGKGRCNVTNDCDSAEILQNIPRNGRFLYSAMTEFPPRRINVSVHSRGTCFPCTALTFKPRIVSHHVCTWDSPVGNYKI